MELLVLQRSLAVHLWIKLSSHIASPPNRARVHWNELPVSLSSPIAEGPPGAVTLWWTIENSHRSNRHLGSTPFSDATRFLFKKENSWAEPTFFCCPQTPWFTPSVHLWHAPLIYLERRPPPRCTHALHKRWPSSLPLAHLLTELCFPPPNPLQDAHCGRVDGCQHPLTTTTTTNPDRQNLAFIQAIMWFPTRNRTVTGYKVSRHPILKRGTKSWESW